LSFGWVLAPVRWLISAIKFLYQGVVYLVSRFVKAIALIVIGAMAIGLLSILVGTHFGLPYLRLIAPDPWITGYVAYYAGLISFVIIPFLLLILLISKIVWRHRRIYKYRYPLAGVWTVTAVLFLSTALFTARNFIFETSVTEQVSEASIGDDRNINIDIRKLKYPDGKVQFNFDHSFLNNGKLYNREGVRLDFVPAEEEKVTVTKTVYSRGTNYQSALGNMSSPDHRIEVTDQNISLDEYYIIDKNGKYRRQRYYYKVAVPLGVTLSFNKGSIILPDRQLRKRNYDPAQKWIMTEEGLQVQQDTVI